MPKVPERKKLTKKQILILCIAAALAVIGLGAWGITALVNSKPVPDSYSYYQESPSRMGRIKDLLITAANEKKALKIYAYSDETYKSEGAGRRVFYTYLNDEGTEMVTTYAKLTDFFTKAQAEQLQELFDKTLVKDVYLEIDFNGDFVIDFNESTNKYGYYMVLSYVSDTPEDDNRYFGTRGCLITQQIDEHWYFLRRVVPQ